MGVGPPVHRVFHLWFWKEPTLQNHILTPKDEGYNIIMEDRWTYGKMDGLDFVRVPDPLGGGAKMVPFLQILERFFEPILHNFGVDFVSIHMRLICFHAKVSFLLRWFYVVLYLSNFEIFWINVPYPQHGFWYSPFWQNYSKNLIKSWRIMKSSPEGIGERSCYKSRDQTWILKKSGPLQNQRVFLVPNFMILIWF